MKHTKKRAVRKGKRKGRGIKGFGKDNRALAIAKVHKYWMTNTMPKSLKSPVPRAYRTTMTCTYSSILAIGFGPNCLADIYLNNLYHPYNTLPASPANNNLTTGLNETALFSAKAPAGFTNIIISGTSALWDRYHVLGTTFKMTVLPIVGGDNLILGIVPYVSAGGTVCGSLGSLEQAPYSKIKTISINTPQKDRSVSVTIDHPKFIGMPVEDYLGESLYSGNYNTIPSLTTAVRIIFNTADNLATTAPIAVKYEMAFDTVFYSAESGDLDDI